MPGAGSSHCVLRDMRRWLDHGIDFGRVAFNLSSAEFRHENLVPRIMGKLAARDRVQLVIVAYETGLVARGVVPGE